MLLSGIGTAETQELPSLAQPLLESQLRLVVSDDAAFGDVTPVAAALGIQVEVLAAGVADPPSSLVTIMALTPRAWNALKPDAQATLLVTSDVALLMACDPEELPDTLPEEQVFAYVPPPLRTRSFLRHVRSAALTVVEKRRGRLLEKELISRTRELRELHAIGTALSTERDLDKLLSLILTKARELAGCDAGSLYLLEEVEGERKLVFRLAENDSIPLGETRPTPLPLSRKSLAGYVAITGQVLKIDDAYDLPEGVEYTLDHSFDEKYGYRTRSVLVVPMTNVQGERLGVLQLINRRRARGAPLRPETVDGEVVSFSTGLVELVLSLAGQAAVCIENNRLYGEVRKLFEGFVTASVTAIEQRDPTTSGHSARVATLTTRLADVVHRSDEPRFRDQAFSADQMKEIRYAALLHDFGKVGVREEVLVKGKKLYPGHLELIRERFAYIRRWVEAESLRRLMAELRGLTGEDPGLGPRLRARLAEVESEITGELGSVDQALATIIAANEPTVLPEGSFEAIAQLGTRSYRDDDGMERPFLTDKEVRYLSIRKGSLDDDERRQIESHVTQTFEFLSQIPWTREFARVPEIAYAHHEKLTGRGYPRKLLAERIPIESRMMTVSDIYDALTASDRPYKKAVPVGRALGIIEDEMKQGMLDADLVRLFIEAKVYEVTSP